MHKILLSPCLLDLSQFYSEKDKLIHISNIKYIYYFISQCLDEVEIILQKGHSDILKNIIDVNYGEEPILCNQLASTFRDFQKYFSAIGNFESDIKVNIKTGFSINDGIYDKSFLNCLYYCDTQQFKGYIFVGKTNKKFEGDPICDKNNMICIFNPYTCDFNIIKNDIKTNLPYDDVFFEMKKICEHTNHFFDTHKGSHSDRSEFMFSFGEITAIRNGYVFDKKLSKLNSKIAGTRRDVYVKYSVSHRPKYYLSVDTERGALELFKHNKPYPIHKGEYNFSCNKNKNAKPITHPLHI